MEWIVLRKLLAGLLLPPTGPLLCAILGLALMGRHRRLGQSLAWTGVCSLVALALPVVALWLVNLAGGGEPLDLSRPTAAQAIVITGGGVRIHAPEYGGQTMAQLTLERARYGAYLARKTGLPVLVTGGVLRKATAEGELMRSALQQEYNLPVRWAEVKSRNTRENAQFTAAVLLPEGVTRILLVTHAFDVRRARLEFEAAGLQVTPAPTVIRPRTAPLALADFLPSASALQSSFYACYELLALLVRAISPR
jgi:uncharacterized SAM-binding protein YcdF (DUF218 family)